jgi:hypothetical protein
MDLSRLLLAAAAGALAGSFVTGLVLSVRHGQVPFSLATKPPIKVELTRFRIRPGEEGTYAEWMSFHRQHQPEMVATLDRERMYFESIFRDETGDGRTIYWLSVEGEGGEPVTTSPHEVDRVHVRFGQRVLERESKYNLHTEFVLMPDWIEEGILRRQSVAQIKPR